MKCKYTVEDIESFMGSIFISKEKQEFMEHLEGCPECKANYTVLSGAENLLKAPVRLEKDMAGSIMNAIDRDMYKRRRLLFTLKGLFFKYPSVVKTFSLIATALILTTIVGFNFNTIAVSLSSLKENINNRLEMSREPKKNSNQNNGDMQNKGTTSPVDTNQADTIQKEAANQLYFSTAIMKETYGRKGPGKDFDEIVKLPYGQVVQIQGWTDSKDGRWYLAQVMPPISEDGSVSRPASEDQQFYIFYDVINTFTQETAYFDDIFYPGVVSEYKYIVRTKDKKDVLLKQLPEDSAPGSAIVGYSNLIAVVEKAGDWSLVKKMNASAMEEVSRVGWIRNSDYSEYSPAMSSIRPNQGFLVKPFKMYSKPDVPADIPERVIKNIITPVNILKWEGEWIYVSSGFNGVGFYVKSSDIRFEVAGEVLAKIINPDVDPETMLAKLKNEISGWKNIKLEALDYPGEYRLDLTMEQKAALASKLTSISAIEKFDGGILPSREAAYPFYTLEFLDDSGRIAYPEGSQENGGSRYDNAMYCSYSFVVAGEDRLLVNLSQRTDYYGLTQYSVPIRFIKVNKEFISYLKTLMPVPQNRDSASFIYLLNASRVNIASMESDFKEEGTEPQQVWKTVRRIMDFVDFTQKPVKLSQEDNKAKIYYELRFTLPDGSVSKVEITDSYISYNGSSYKYNAKITGGGEPLENIIGGLFVAYF